MDQKDKDTLIKLTAELENIMNTDAEKTLEFINANMEVFTRLGLMKLMEKYSEIKKKEPKLTFKEFLESQ